MTRVEVNREFRVPVHQAFEYLAEHENLESVFGAKIQRVRDGDTDRNGTGSVRRLKIGPLPAFEETVTRVVPDELIEYCITHGSPLRNHRGVMSFSPTDGGSRLHYVITYDAAPGLASVIKLGLTRQISKGLAAVDRS